MLLLEAMDPIMVMLTKRLDFQVQLCQAIEFPVANALGSKGSMLVDNHKISWITRDGRIFFDRGAVFIHSKLLNQSEWADNLSRLAAASQSDQEAICEIQDLVSSKGLELDKDFVCDDGDVAAFIGFHAILSILAQECDHARGRDTHFLSLRDTLSAISCIEPKLKNHIKMSHFRMCLVNRMMSEFLYSLQEQGAGLERDTEQEESGLELDVASEDDDVGMEGVES